MGLSLTDCNLIEGEAVPLVAEKGAVVTLGVTKIVRGDRSIRKPHDYFVNQCGFKRVLSMDAVDWEGCDRILDLNEPLPKCLESFADLIIDPGTLEHIFRSGQALENLVRMLKPGGVIYHHSPLNWIDHGFFNPCPALFFDTYKANSFEPIKVWTRSTGGPPQVWRYDPLKTRPHEKPGRWLIHCVAAKPTTHAGGFTVPTQGRYQHQWKGHR
jgi:SAM-dependent methyltransferase